MTREALAFDMYGTLVDPLRIWTQLEQHLPGNAVRAAEIWRQKQLEYTFRLTVMEQYEDFEQVTRKALDYALAAIGGQLSDEQKQQLMAQYNDLARFPDVQSGLEQLQAKGHTMVVFSNGSPAMLSAIMQAAQLEPYFQSFISVDEIKIYKPSPKVYQLVAHKVQRPIGEIRLISSNPFDIIGARNAGMQATWINRSQGLFDTLGERPTMVVATIEELARSL
ncbi:MAG: haloacid dehalogenase type II [Ktedonobacteraceae bacterium]